MPETDIPLGVPAGWTKVPSGATIRGGSPYAICYRDWHVVIYPGHDEDWTATMVAPAYYASESSIVPPVAPIPDDAQYLIADTTKHAGLLLRRTGAYWYDECLDEVIGDWEIVSYQVLTAGARLSAPKPEPKPESGNPGYHLEDDSGNEWVWCDGCGGFRWATPHDYCFADIGRTEDEVRFEYGPVERVTD